MIISGVTGCGADATAINISLWSCICFIDLAICSVEADTARL